jgi:hypothetical protein
MRIAAKSHRDPLQVRIAAKMHKVPLRVRGATKSHRVLWRVSSAAKLYRVFEKKKRKVLEVRVKTEEPHVRTGTVLQAKTVCTWGLHYFGTGVDRICRIVVHHKQKKYAHGARVIRGSPAPGFDGACRAVSCTPL